MTSTSPLGLQWFLACLNRAFDGAEKVLAGVLRKADFWKKHSTVAFNDRQRGMINRLLEGFRRQANNFQVG